ncbi:thioesterase [Alteromonas sp. 5E99-2]|uniref:thioesterase II family protein n=1 Tax=Alteromonas sp. 5E99-2 TaxID=2817683 RepID=UPI001A985CF5|nr:thioesterase [Alteromonas sp. 5E99-2]MBO1255102.1 thioesterase [Alteromonas sp. 5E99-2]
MLNNSCLVIPKPQPNAQLKLICFPYAGGSISTYTSWAQYLPENVELCIVQLPGRGQRMFEKPHTNMQAVINELISVLPQYIKSPYIVFGHSLGSRIAFELMLTLHNLNLPLPEYFIASGSRSPDSSLNKKNIFHLPNDEFIHELEKLNGTPKAVLENKELMDLFMPLLRADFELVDTYCYLGTAKLNCQITILGGIDDTDISKEQLANWQQFFIPTVNIHMIPGNHFFIDNQKEHCLEKVNDIIHHVIKPRV